MKSSILIIDDSKKLRRQVVDILQKTGLFQSILEAGNGIEGLKVLLDKKPDLILCDVDMPGLDGFKFLSMLNSQEELKDIPVILLTGLRENGSKIRGLELGARDYIIKPFDHGEFLARIKVQLKIKSLQDSLKESNRKHLELSQKDPLTGLNNRRRMMKTLEEELERSGRTGDPLSLILLDCDGFKAINDIHGHLKGDEVLKLLAGTFQRHLRQYDSVARYGGDEFALILPNTDLCEAGRIAERVRQEVEQMKVGAGDAEFQVTISLGIANVPRKQMEIPEDLIREADCALYDAKREGRNQIKLSGTSIP